MVRDGSTHPKAYALLGISQPGIRQIASTIYPRIQVNVKESKADKEIKNAMRQHDIILEEARKEAENEARLLIEVAKAKEESAINLVISKVI